MTVSTAYSLVIFFLYAYPSRPTCDFIYPCMYLPHNLILAFKTHVIKEYVFNYFFIALTIYFSSFCVKLF